ncbi:MAG: DUF2283 domain-containing protein [Planctomycetota bacterium]
MKFHYYPETDSLYIDLADRPGAESREVAPGVVLDFDVAGRLVGMDIDQASQVVDLSRLEAVQLPVHELLVGNEGK